MVRFITIDSNEITEVNSISDLRMLQSVLDEIDPDIFPFLSNWSNQSNNFIEVSTSGSTGESKIIEIPKSSMIASAKATLEYFQLKRDNSILLCLPTKFIAGKMIWVRALVGDLTVVASRPNSNPISNLTTSVDFAAMTPHQVEKSLDENPEKFDLINKLIIGGAPVSPNLLKRLQNIQTKCYATYGMTETVTHVAVKKLNYSTNDFFEGLPNVSFALGQDDNLIITAPHLSKEKVVTNDVVELISNSSFQWLGRKDFVINSGGVKLFPERIEDKISKAGILNCEFLVSEKSDSLFGSLPVLVVASTNQNYKEILSQIFEVVDKFERPSEVFFLENLPMTLSGKIDRKEVKRLIN